MSDYNGWTNYETWNVSLWLGNDEGTDYQVREMVADVFETVTEPRYDFETLEDSRGYELAERLADYVLDLAEMTCPGVIEGASFVADIFGAALSSVDYREIAGHYVTDYEYETETV